MLFDLRSPHRRRVIKVVYVFLALLIGGGLIFFGVGTGNNSGGLLSNVGGGGGGANGQSAYTSALASAEKKAKAAPNDPASWAAVGRAAFNLAQLPTNYVSNQGYTASGHAVLVKLKQAWNRYLALAPAKPDVTFADQVVAAFGSPPGIADYRTAESAQEVVASTASTQYTQYEYLAYYAYLADEPTRGDLAAARALALAPAKLRKQTQTALKSIKSQALAAANGATGATG
jgi:hypothetical protein